MNSNYYMTCVFKNNTTGQVFHAVYIHHALLVSFAVFNSDIDSMRYVYQQQARAATRGIYFDRLTGATDPTMKTFLKHYKSASVGMFSKLENRQVYINQRGAVIH